MDYELPSPDKVVECKVHSTIGFRRGRVGTTGRRGLHSGSSSSAPGCGRLPGRSGVLPSRRGSSVPGDCVTKYASYILPFGDYITALGSYIIAALVVVVSHDAGDCNTRGPGAQGGGTGTPSRRRRYLETAM